MHSEWRACMGDAVRQSVDAEGLGTAQRSVGLMLSLGEAPEVFMVLLTCGYLYWVSQFVTLVVLKKS